MDPQIGYFGSEVTLAKLLWSQISIWTYNTLIYFVGTHFELQQHLEAHLAQKLSACNKFA